MKLPETIKIEHPVSYDPISVDTQHYIRAKTKDLQAFGYEKLTEEMVSEQLLKVLNGGELDVIGMFIEKDIIKD